MAIKNSSMENLPIPEEFIERRIFLIRGQKVMLDNDLAELYQVPTFRLNEAVKRNFKRFPNELKTLASQFAISKLEGRGGRRTLPYAFTEHGVVMLSSVLNSPKAIQMNIIIVRAFIKMRQLMGMQKDLATKVTTLELNQKAQEIILTNIVKDINKIKNPPLTRAIGFKVD